MLITFIYDEMFLGLGGVGIGGGTGGTCPLPQFFQRTKSALFCDEKCPFL